MLEVIFLDSELTIIESTVVSSQFKKMLRYDKESVPLALKYIKGGVSCVHAYYLLQ